MNHSQGRGVRFISAVIQVNLESFQTVKQLFNICLLAQTVSPHCASGK